MKAFYSEKPQVFEAVGNGSFLYRWNIGHVDNEDAGQWQCEEVTVWLPLNADKVKETVINELWPKNYEQKLINDFNASLLGMYDDETAELKKKLYTQFLAERDMIKKQVEEDFKTYKPGSY